MNVLRPPPPPQFKANSEIASPYDYYFQELAFLQTLIILKGDHMYLANDLCLCCKNEFKEMAFFTLILKTLEKDFRILGKNRCLHVSSRYLVYYGLNPLSYKPYADCGGYTLENDHRLTKKMRLTNKRWKIHNTIFLSSLLILHINMTFLVTDHS